MDRFSENGGGDEAERKPATIVAVEEFQVSVEKITTTIDDVDETVMLYKIACQDREDRAMVAFTSESASVLVGALLQGAATACDEQFLAGLMVALTERRETSLDVLFGSGHAKDSLPDF